MGHPPPDPVLPPGLCRSALNALRAVLPRPLTCNPADTTDRDLEAMAQVTALYPANNAEVALAVPFVMAHALAMDIMQVITESPIDALKHWAASANVMRQSRGALSSLLRLQAVQMKEARRAGAVDDAEPAPSVTTSETESRLTGSETPMRPDSSAAPPTASPHPAVAPIELDRDLMARLAADPALKRPPNTARPRYVSRHASPASRFVPSYETGSGVPCDEIGVRQTNPSRPPRLGWITRRSPGYQATRQR